MNLTFIKDAYTENTGGGVMVDVLVMNDGKVITVTDECVVVNENMQAWEEQTGPDDKIIWLV